MPFPPLATIVRSWGSRRPAAPALSFPGGAISYGELHERSSRVANGLAAAGVRPGDRVALLARNSPVFFEVVFGAAKLNAVPAALNWRLSPSEIGAVLDDIDPRVLLVDAEFAGPLSGEAPRRIVVGAGDGASAYDEWKAGQSPTDPEVDADDDDLALLVYTSGTTGRPRGVEATHAAVSFLLSQTVHTYGFGPGSVTLAAMPLFHVSGSGWSLVCLQAGGKVVILPDVDPTGMLQVIEAERVTHMSLVTTVMEFLLAHPRSASTDLSSLEVLAYGGSPATTATIARATERFRCRLIQLYGLSETIGAVTELSAADHDDTHRRPERLLSCGVPYDWVEVRVTDPGTGEPVPPGATGEICVRTPHRMRGYRGRPEETAEVVAPDGWLRTGDAGYVDADGYVYLQDRVKDMIISGGENVYPIEVEKVIAGHPDVAGAAVIGVPDDRWGEVPRAVVIPADENHAGPDLAAELIAWCRDRLAHYKCPKVIDFASDFPRTGSGKVLKRQLRAPYWAGRPRQI